MTLSIGAMAPDFSAPSDNGKTLKLSDFRGQKVVLYFYPKDDTSGCTAEACDFRDSITQFRKLDCVVLGVSKDSINSHKKFKSKYGLNFNLLSDEAGNLCETYGVWVEKSMYGRTYMGIERSTFLIDENGRVQNVWRKVSVPGHVMEIQSALGLKAAPAKSSAKPATKKAAKSKPAKTKKANVKSKKPVKPAKVNKVKKPAKTTKNKSKKPVKKSAAARRKIPTVKNKRKKA